MFKLYSAYRYFFLGALLLAESTKESIRRLQLTTLLNIHVGFGFFVRLKDRGFVRLIFHGPRNWYLILST